MLRAHRRAHARIWSLAALVLPALVIAGLVLKQTQRPLPAPVQLDAAAPGSGLPPAVNARP